LSIQERYRISFWDAQILAAARRAGCSKVYSEDMQDGAVYGGMRVIDPFSPHIE
jgi:predicted nucleic acid-binding protein